MDQRAERWPSGWGAGAWTRACCRVIAAVCLGGAVSAAAQAGPLVQAVSGSGQWVVTAPSDATTGPAAPEGGDPAALPDGGGTAPTRWHVEATFVNGETLEGVIAMTSGATTVLRAGRVTGRVQGATVWGEITDDAGAFFATFEGVVGPAGLQGTFTGRADDQGVWSWDGPVPVAAVGVRRQGLPGARSLVAIVVLTAAIVAGAKLHFLLEGALFPAVDGRAPAHLAATLAHGFRIPGGVLLLTLLLPAVCWALALPPRRFADAVVPAVALAFVFTRTGCFLNGCCWGRVTEGPLGMAFPPAAQVYAWQLRQGVIPPFAAATLPVHPLQLYFARHALAVYAYTRRLQRRPHAEGQVWVAFTIAFFAGTFALEFLRPAPLYLNRLLSAAVTLLALAAAWRQRAGRVPR